jgi:hypothetical protein
LKDYPRYSKWHFLSEVILQKNPRSQYPINVQITMPNCPRPLPKLGFNWVDRIHAWLATYFYYQIVI